MTAKHSAAGEHVAMKNPPVCSTLRSTPHWLLAGRRISPNLAAYFSASLINRVRYTPFVSSNLAHSATSTTRKPPTTPRGRINAPDDGYLNHHIIHTMPSMPSVRDECASVLSPNHPNTATATRLN
ncbi:hypothetical protein RB213_012116, partial [Colletotrichum asianum]